jgi:5-methylthioadenosine/S-adenosylhomocysteine deaminase
VIIDGGAVNVAPIIDPVAAVVLAADISNVETVIVDGKVVKENGKLLADLDAPRKAVEASRDYLVGQVEPQEGWLVAARA